MWNLASLGCMLPHHSLTTWCSGFDFCDDCCLWWVWGVPYQFMLNLLFFLECIWSAPLTLHLDSVLWVLILIFLIWKCCLFKNQVGCGEWELALSMLNLPPLACMSLAPFTLGHRFLVFAMILVCKEHHEDIWCFNSQPHRHFGLFQIAVTPAGFDLWLAVLF